ncbi:MAG TPA: hypothetical protein VGO80_01935 [Solirubrobacteraceae bacterium]|jgi:hypothetical protein|nr:hypothetical protein [Solirubrobacteraceae bacterium]
MSPVSPRRRLTLVSAAAIATLAASAVPAMASGATACPAAATSNPFAPWGDNADYQLAPGGSVERGSAGWSLAGGAGVVEGNEPFMVTSRDDQRSMRLPASSSATTARMCVGLGHPTFRFFAKRSSGPASSTLTVEVVYNDASGRERTMGAGRIAGSNAWAPSSKLPTMVERIATRSATVKLSFRFKPQGRGTWAIDDVYVDPHRLP